ncbi:DUF4879 domain-containing protein [Stenotrophomonas sp. HMWF023]|nr:DUF4879 domain-containing protein [Stenotrophomonas sp. HMWF023]
MRQAIERPTPIPRCRSLYLPIAPSLEFSKKFYSDTCIRSHRVPGGVPTLIAQHSLPTTGTDMRKLIVAAVLAVVTSPAMASEVTMSVREFPSLHLEGTSVGRTIKSEGWEAVARDGERGPAPPITQVAVLAVGSTDAGGWEYMTTLGQLITQKNHGGPELRVVVREIGYGGTPMTSLFGQPLPTSAEYRTDGLCITDQMYTDDCQPGQTIVGWLRYFNLDGYQEGKFWFTNRSINSPGKLWETGIHIQ